MQQMQDADLFLLYLASQCERHRGDAVVELLEKTLLVGVLQQVWFRVTKNLEEQYPQCLDYY